MCGGSDHETQGGVCVCSPGIPVLVGTGTTETNIYCRKILRLYLSLVFDDLANLDTALVTNNCI